jgi:hypothetical protein
VKPRHCFSLGMLALALGLWGSLAKAADPKNSFAGTWSTRTETGGAYELVLRVRGMRVTGTFSEKNPKYNGTLRGTVRGNALNYTFKQTVTGGTGRGSWVLRSGGSRITGSFAMNGDPKKRYSWNGHRQAPAQPGPPRPPSDKIEDQPCYAHCASICGGPTEQARRQCVVGCLESTARCTRGVP